MQRYNTTVTNKKCGSLNMCMGKSVVRAKGATMNANRDVHENMVESGLIKT